MLILKENEPTIKWCLDQANGIRSIWQFYKMVASNPLKLANCTYLWLNSDCFPGKGFMESCYYDEDNIERWWSAEPATNEEWLALGLSNFKTVQQHINPFSDQAKLIEDAYREHTHKYASSQQYVSSGLKFQERSSYARINPNRGHVRFVLHEQDCMFSEQIETTLLPWVVDWLAEAQRAAFQLISKLLSDKIKHIVPASEVCFDDELRLKQCWILKSPLDALYLTLYKELTQSSLVRHCPHPTCGRFFIPSRRDQASCGLEKCQKYVTQQRKKR